MEQQQQQQNKDIKEKKDVEIWREQNNIIISGDNQDNQIFHPYLTFQDTNMSNNVLQVMKDFKNPTILQSSTWPFIINKRDCLASACAGSGKTLSYLLPVFNHLQQIKNNQSTKKSKQPKIIIILPSREQVFQTYQFYQNIESILGISSICICGGVSQQDQLEKLQQGPQIISCTVGRFCDLMEKIQLKIDEVDMLIIEEMDRLLNLGFLQEINFVFGKIKQDCQKIIFTSVITKQIYDIVNINLKQPIIIQIGAYFKNYQSVTQNVEVIQEQDLQEKFFQKLSQYNVNSGKTIIYATYRSQISEILEIIQKLGYSASVLHSKQQQKERIFQFQEFQQGKNNILVTTDLSCKSLDIKNVQNVINYSLPLNIEDYENRTKLAQNSFSFFIESIDKKLTLYLIMYLQKIEQKVNPELEKIVQNTSLKDKYNLENDKQK